MQLNNREDLRTIRDEVISNLNDMLTKHGISAKIPGNMTFDREGNFVSFKVELVAGKSKEEMDLERFACVDGVNLLAGARDAGGAIGKCWLVGYNRRARKYPYIVARCSDGAQFKMTPMVAKLTFGGGE